MCLRLRVAGLDESLEPLFWNHVNADPVGYYFFIFDWKLRHDQSKIFLALQGKKDIVGLMLIYRDHVLQLRGSHEAVEALLESLVWELGKPVELQAPFECEQLVIRKFGEPKVRQRMMIMSLRRGEEKINVTTQPERLTVEDARDIASLMQKADPGWWGEIPVDFIQNSFQTDAYWLGVKQNGKLVSVGMARLTDFGSNVNIVATDMAYRSRGYATSIVSVLVQEILKISNLALIHVIAENTSAVRAYAKVGYKPHQTYLLVRT